MKSRRKNNNKESTQYLDARYEELSGMKIFTDLEDNKRFLKELFKDCSDVVIREFQIQKNISALAVFVDGLIQSEQVNEALKALMILEGQTEYVEDLNTQSLPVNQTETTDNYGDFLLAVLSGDTGILVQNNERALTLSVKGFEKRSVSEPDTEAVIKGPREGFVESLRTNTSLLRRRIKSPRLKIKSMIVGRESNTFVAICYIEGIVDPELLDEVIRRIESIKMNGILESSYIEEFIQDNALSPFPQVQYSERPDTVAAALLEGRIAVFVDGTPFVLIVPTTFWMLMQASEDYYETFLISTLIRWLRFVFLIISLTFPALYIAMTAFHKEMLPTTLLLSIVSSREHIPFPVAIEAFIMEITFEALREAGIRLPKQIGQTFSILGAIVVGQAAVEAGIVSAPIVIVVSITGIASFTIPRFNGAVAIRMLRFPLMVAASLFGMYGILLGLMWIVGHMARLRSFGVPYLSPAAPLSVPDLQDVFVRLPWWAMIKNPTFLSLKDQNRVDPDAARKEYKQQIFQEQVEEPAEKKQNGQKSEQGGNQSGGKNES